ncbi:hypothetical protein [Streptomyces sp. NPDC091259]|uniref:hypothetical protein n=1 Tax=Streptomyces sp. NPDC091259 TaxID=3365976 RepID=UPI0037F1B9B6
MQYEERYVLRRTDATEDTMRQEYTDEAVARSAFDMARKSMPRGSHVELRREMFVIITTAAKA